MLHVCVESTLLYDSCSSHAIVLADVMELQQQFEQDKKKIAEWKASRRFKPY